MKILLINHFPLEGSGSGVYTMNIAKSLLQKGHEVCIIMPENKTDYKKPIGGDKMPSRLFLWSRKDQGTTAI